MIHYFYVLKNFMHEYACYMHDICPISLKHACSMYILFLQSWFMHGNSILHARNLHAWNVLKHGCFRCSILSRVVICACRMDKKTRNLVQQNFRFHFRSRAAFVISMFAAHTPRDMAHVIMTTLTSQRVTVLVYVLCSRLCFIINQNNYMWRWIFFVCIVCRSLVTH